MSRILIVEDEIIVATDLQRMLERAGNTVTGIAVSVEEAMELLESSPPEWVFLDIYLVGALNGIDLARELRGRGIPFIYISANSSQSILEAAKQTEPYGFIVKPFRQKDVLVMLDVARYRHEQGVESRWARERASEATRPGAKSMDPASGSAGITENAGLIGESGIFRQTKQQLELVAGFDVSVLLLGESGTGKEMAAQLIHRLSPRRQKQMVKVNCGAIPLELMESELFGHERGAFTGAEERRIGRFEQAAGGTLFLDEVGELPQELQVKLLSVLQDKEITRLGAARPIATDVRIIAATNRNLEKEVAEGRFRLDLYYRLNVFPVTMPSLRDRAEDIPLLANHLLAKLSAQTASVANCICPEAMQVLKQHHWPGNVRELENILERTMLTTREAVIRHIHLPYHNTTLVTADEPLKTIKEVEREHILTALKKCNGRITGAGGAAQILDIPPSTLMSRMNKLGIVKDFTG